MKLLILLLLISINGFGQVKLSGMPEVAGGPIKSYWIKLDTPQIIIKDTFRFSNDFKVIPGIEADTAQILGTPYSLIFKGDSVILYNPSSYFKGGIILMNDTTFGKRPKYYYGKHRRSFFDDGEMLFYEIQGDPSVKCEALIKGKRIEFDYDKDDATPMNGYLYLGSTKVIYYAGVKNVWPKPHYLFKKLYR